MTTSPICSFLATSHITATRMTAARASRPYQTYMTFANETVNCAAAALGGDEYVPLPTTNGIPKSTASATAE